MLVFKLIAFLMRLKVFRTTAEHTPTISADDIKNQQQIAVASLKEKRIQEKTVRSSRRDQNGGAILNIQRRRLFYDSFIDSGFFDGSLIGE